MSNINITVTVTETLRLTSAPLSSTFPSTLLTLTVPLVPKNVLLTVSLFFHRLFRISNYQMNWKGMPFALWLIHIHGDGYRSLSQGWGLVLCRSSHTFGDGYLSLLFMCPRYSSISCMCLCFANKRNIVKTLISN